MDKGLLNPEGAPAPEETEITPEAIESEIENPDQIEIEPSNDFHIELDDEESDATTIIRYSLPCFLRWCGLQPLTDDEKKADTSPMCCTSVCIKRPLILLAVVLVPIVVLCIMGFRSEAHLDLGIDQFRLSNQDCRIQRQDMLVSAKNDAKKAIDVNSKRLYHRRRLGQTWTVLARLEVLYYPKKGDNILTGANFKEIHRIEKILMSRRGFEKYCMGGDSVYEENGLPPPDRVHTYGDYRDCAPLQSMMTYFFPSTLSDGQVVYDGLSDEMLPFEVRVEAISGVEDVHYFVDASADLAKGKAAFLKTLFLFAVPFPAGSEMYKKTKREFVPWLLEYTDMFENHIDSDQVRVVHGGEIITENEIKNIVYNDSKYAVMSVVFVMAYSVWYLRSFFLALLGILQITCTLPITFYVCQLIHRIPGYAKLTDLGVMNVLSLYLLLGIGVDDLYVMADAFRQAKRTTKLEDGTTIPVSNRLRMSYAFRRSAQAMFLTSLTTAVAFLANMTIIIPVIYQFVLFMALLIIINYILAVTVFPLLLSVREKLLVLKCCGRTPCERRIEQWCGYLHGGLCMACARSARSRCRCPRRQQPESPAMIALTDIISDPESDPEPTEDAAPSSEELGDSGNQHDKPTWFGRTLAAATIHPRFWIWQPLVILVAFLVFFGVSLWSASQLQSAHGIPGLFRADDNIQIFLNSLTKSFGKRYCYDCSANHFYDSLCASNSCSNHGECSNGVCTCHPGWSGAKCSSNRCSSVYCGPEGHGTCRGGKCACSPGFKGDQCQFVDRCEVPIPISCPKHQWCSNGKCLCVEGYKKVFGVCTRQSTSKPIAVSPRKPSKCPVNPAGSYAGHAYPSGTCDDAVTLARRRGMDLNCDTIKRLLPAWNCAGCICANLATTRSGQTCGDPQACNYKAGGKSVGNGVCTYAKPNRDCKGHCVVSRDCAGVCGGRAKYDRCGVCGGDDRTCTGCMDASACNYDKRAKVPDSRMCNFAKQGYNCFSVCTTRKDCGGECGGVRTIDRCGVCGGDGQSCATSTAIDTTTTPTRRPRPKTTTQRAKTRSPSPSPSPKTTTQRAKTRSPSPSPRPKTTTQRTRNTKPVTRRTSNTKTVTRHIRNPKPVTRRTSNPKPITRRTSNPKPVTRRTTISVTPRPTARTRPRFTSFSSATTAVFVTAATSQADILPESIWDIFKVIDPTRTAVQTVNVEVDKRTSRLSIRKQIAKKLHIPPSRVVLEPAKRSRHRRLGSTITYTVTVLPPTACADKFACNFKANAACSYQRDCANVCGGNAQKDICGVCGGKGDSCAGCMDPKACNYDRHAKIKGTVKCKLPSQHLDCFSNCKVDVDCAGECGGHHEKDHCGVCGGNDSTCTGCMDRRGCNFDSNARRPGTCFYPKTNKNCDGKCLVQVDCFGRCGGKARNDKCGVCGGDGTSCSSPTTSVSTASVDAGQAVQLLCPCSGTMNADKIPPACINGVLKVCRSPSLKRWYSQMCMSCEASYNDPELPWDSCAINVIRSIDGRCARPQQACTATFCSGHGKCSVAESPATVHDRRVCKCDAMYTGSKCDACNAPLREYPDCNTPAKAETRPLNINRAKVSVVWGLDGITYASRYQELANKADGFTTSYDSGFDLNDPAAQLFLYDACFNISSQGDLVQQRRGSGQDASDCFILDFKLWLEQQGMHFPVDKQNFVKYLHLFWVRNGGTSTKQFGFDNYTSPSRVTFAAFTFYTDIPKYGSGFKRAPYFTAWEKAMHALNDRAPSTANGAMQSCTIWEAVFTEVIAVSGTLYSIVVVLLIAFWAILVFTTNFVAALLAIASIMFALVVILASFHWLGWTLGIVEAIGISILLGAAVDYPLHLVESYIETSPEVARDDGDMDTEQPSGGRRCCNFSRAHIQFRRRVITRALSKIGPSILNSSVTTSGCVLFLFACRINIFVKVGTIMLLSSVVSITLSMFLLPPLLILFGPMTFNRDCKRVGILVVGVGALFGLCLLVLYFLSLAGVAINGPSGTPLFYNRFLQDCVDPMY